MELRESALELQNENFELKAQLKIKYEQLNKIQDYKLVQTIGGAMVYESIEEPKHYICPKCFTNKEIQILQNKNLFSGKFNCPNCNNAYKVKETKNRTSRVSLY